MLLGCRRKPKSVSPHISANQETTRGSVNFSSASFEDIRSARAISSSARVERTTVSACLATVQLLPEAADSDFGVMCVDLDPGSSAAQALGGDESGAGPQKWIEDTGVSLPV